MKKYSKCGVLFRLIGLVKPLAGFMCLAVLTGTLGYLAVQFIPVLGGYAVLYGLGFSIPVSMTMLCVCLVAFAVLRAVLRYTEQRTNHYIAFTLLAIIRDKVFQALRKLCPAKLEGRDKGTLISVITSDVELLEVFYAHTISPICIAVLTEAVMYLFLAQFHWAYGYVGLLAFAAVGIFLPVYISRKCGAVGDEIRRQSGTLAAYVLENIRGLDGTIQYQNEAARKAGMQQKSRQLSEQQDQMNRLTGINQALTNTLILVSDVVMLALGVFLYRSGAVEFDGLLIPMVAFMSSFGPVTALANLGTTLQNTIASGRRVLEILDDVPETADISGEPEISFSGVSCDAVNFTYGNEMILQELSMDFPQNQIIGVSGKSGSGKSTLLKLLMRFWNVTSGQICISGTEINHVNTQNLRQMESYMTQETQLFQDTIANNVRIGKLDATQEEIETACKKAAIHEWILTLPQGYDTQVGEMGETLSGGERQRIGLARAFLHDAPLMLLDEPTSNLDSLNEAVILRSLKEKTAGKTVVMVSHRESAMRIADQVYSVENGRVS